MNIHSIKFKIICWYTTILILVFAIVLGGSFIAAEYYGESNVKSELQDEIKDLQEDVLRYPDYFPREDLLSYYDDGVMLSLYDEDQDLINGVVPDDFPENIGFEENHMRKIHVGEENWYLDDKQIKMQDGTIIWVRGIHSYSPIVWMTERMIILFCILFPVLMLAAVFLGYHMIQRSLRPLQQIITTANEISDSGDINAQLPLPAVRDEFYDLTLTFNHMFKTLQETFHRERQFSSDAAHELRTPVSILLSHCEYCLEELDLTAEAREELEIIRKKALQMSELVGALLDLSRTEDHSMHPVLENIDLPMLAESVAEELEEKAAAKKIHLEVVSFMKSPFILADMGMMARLFINLMENGISYGKENGYVHVQLYSKDSDVCIRIKDNGIGIPEDALDKIWDRFYQVDLSHSESPGFGLGLPMVRQIVACHDGKIRVESQVGKGTVFTVVLPGAALQDEA